MPEEVKRHECRCGRTIPEEPDGILKAHKVGKVHPAFPGMSKAKRRETSCPGPDEERKARAEAEVKAAEAKLAAEVAAATAAQAQKEADDLAAIAKELEPKKEA